MTVANSKTNSKTHLSYVQTHKHTQRGPSKRGSREQGSKIAVTGVRDSKSKERSAPLYLIFLLFSNGTRRGRVWWVRISVEALIFLSGLDILIRMVVEVVYPHLHGVTEPRSRLCLLRLSKERSGDCTRIFFINAKSTKPHTPLF
jgi:hypothetical protein